MSNTPVNFDETVEATLQEETTNLVKCHIVNLADHYLDVDKSLSNNSKELITTTLEKEIHNTANAVAALFKANIITMRQCLACMVRLAEVKSDYLKL